MTVLALADLHDAAGQAGVPWTLMLDEFGAVIKMAASRAVAILQRGRSHGGQVIVVTQSVADPEALSGQPGLLPSLTDNFSGVVAHRQTAPESRDWLAKLMGTRALWQSTNQTSGHGTQHSGRGSARRVREFRIGSDTFAELGRGRGRYLYEPRARPAPHEHPPRRVRRPSARADRSRPAARVRAARPSRAHACRRSSRPPARVLAPPRSTPVAPTCDLVQIRVRAVCSPCALRRARAAAIYRDEVSNACSKARGKPCPTAAAPPCSAPAAECLAATWPARMASSAAATSAAAKSGRIRRSSRQPRYRRTTVPIAPTPRCDRDGAFAARRPRAARTLRRAQ